jgi:putative flippase GtrA
VLDRLKNSQIANEFLRFASIGALATVLHYSILVFLVDVLHGPVIISTSIGFIAGAVLSYSLNRKITFSHQPHFTHGLVKFVIVGFAGLGINASIVAVLIWTGLQYLLAQMVATSIVLVWNFFVARLMVFRPKATAG